MQKQRDDIFRSLLSTSYHQPAKRETHQARCPADSQAQRPSLSARDSSVSVRTVSPLVCAGFLCSHPSLLRRLSLLSSGSRGSLDHLPFRLPAILRLHSFHFLRVTQRRGLRHPRLPMLIPSRAKHFSSRWSSPSLRACCPGEEAGPAPSSRLAACPLIHSCYDVRSCSIDASCWHLMVIVI